MSDAKLIASSVLSGSMLIAAATASIGGTRTEAVAWLFGLVAFFFFVPTLREIVGSLEGKDIRSFFTGRSPD